MEKLFLGKKLPNFIIVEGLWRMGKTIFIEKISKLDDYKIILESNHVRYGIEKDISQWYRKKHKERFRKAVYILKKSKVIMERSLLSNAAYEYAKTGKISREYKKVFSELNKIEDITIVFLYADKKFSSAKIKLINDPTVKTPFLEDKNFYDRYVSFYKKILPKNINKKIINIKTEYKGKFIKPSLVFLKFIRKLET